MIDKRVNVCYVITVEYQCYLDNHFEIRKQKFISQHSLSSKRFNSFSLNYLKKIPYFDSIVESSQLTISNKSWLLPEIRVFVLEGISESEKCY